MQLQRLPHPGAGGVVTAGLLAESLHVTFNLLTHAPRERNGFKVGAQAARGATALAAHRPNSDPYRKIPARVERPADVAR